MTVMSLLVFDGTGIPDDMEKDTTVPTFLRGSRLMQLYSNRALKIQPATFLHRPEAQRAAQSTIFAPSLAAALLNGLSDHHANVILTYLRSLEGHPVELLNFSPTTTC